MCVPAHNEESTIERTIDSLLNLDYPKNKLKIIVVNDCSTDKTWEVIQKYKDKVELINKTKNPGKAESVNLAIAKCKTEFFGVLDADSIVDKGALKKSLAYFDDEKVIAVTPGMKIEEPGTFLQKIQYVEYIFGVFLRKVFAFLDSIHVVPGPFSIYRKWFFDKHGEFDTNNLTEDTEMAMRIQLNHYRIENAIDAKVYTKCPKKFGPLLSQRIRWYVGFMKNCIKYKKLFSLKYKILGLLVLPSSFLSVGLTLFFFFYSIFKIIEFLVDVIRNYFIIGFDLVPLFKSFRFDLFYLYLGPVFFLSICSTIIFFGMLYIGNKYSDHEEKSVIAYPLFIVFYSYLFAFWWILSLFYKLFNIKIRWGVKKL
ncbi:MAG: glycosyltransferase [Nanoarchaeota archaeon]